MHGEYNTLFLRLEGPLQAWGDNSKFVVRRTAGAPTKSGVLGMICCAMGVTRPNGRAKLERLNTLSMGVRVDRAGTLWSDYHTVGAGVGMITAQGDLKSGAKGTLVTRRYYLCDASFLVALQGDEGILCKVRDALRDPQWPIFLGRKACPPTSPVVTGKDEEAVGNYGDLRSALISRPWRRRFSTDPSPQEMCLLWEWRPSAGQPYAPADAEVWDDTPVSFDPPVHHPRLVIRELAPASVDDRPLQTSTPAPPRPRANYRNGHYGERRKQRLADDKHLCVFCKVPIWNQGATVHHITYRRAGGNEKLDDLRSLCRLCHDAVTMIEYGLNMGLDRINPEDARWRDHIIEKRKEIIRFRSLATRRRYLEAEEVE